MIYLSDWFSDEDKFLDLFLLEMFSLIIIDFIYS